MAIALTNALLYERLEEARRLLEQRVEERTRELQTTLNELSAAYDRSERLLLNILPASVAQRLKSGAEQIADRYEEATALFADLVGFSALAAAQSAQETVRLLSDIFSSSDGAVGACESGRVQVSAAVALSMARSFEFERRGLVSVKGRGEMIKYFLVQPRG